MVKRKKANKQKEAKSKKAAVHKVLTPQEEDKRLEMPVPALLMKLLAGILAAIMVAALTMYVLGSIKARGFWSLTILVAIIAFFVLPAMRKRFLGSTGSK
ncbi:MAG: hypothetical protein V1729_01110 [Candidatus Woesearchaeota archaeon]